MPWYVNEQQEILEVVLNARRLQRYKAYESPASSVMGSTLHIHTERSSIEPFLETSTTSSGLTVRTYHPLYDLFAGRWRTWSDYFCPRIACIQVTQFSDGTIFKFTVQHVACDAHGMRTYLVSQF